MVTTHPPIPKIQRFIFFGNLKNPKKSGNFDTRGSPVALFVLELSVEISFTLYSLINLSGRLNRSDAGISEPTTKFIGEGRL